MVGGQLPVKLATGSVDTGFRPDSGALGHYFNDKGYGVFDPNFDCR